MRTIRTFLAIAVEPLVAAKASKVIGAAAAGDKTVRWVPTDDLYLTIKFLGEVDNTLVNEVCQTTRTICEDFEPFDLTFGGADALPSRSRPRSLVFSIDDPSHRLRDLVGRLETAFADLGYKPEPRDYVPHLTAGRARSGHRLTPTAIDRWIQPRHAIDRPMTASRVLVVGSFLEDQGPTYNVLDTIEL